MKKTTHVESMKNITNRNKMFFSLHMFVVLFIIVWLFEFSDQSNGRYSC